jgi:hypothetical protein
MALRIHSFSSTNLLSGAFSTTYLRQTCLTVLNGKGGRFWVFPRGDIQEAQKHGLIGKKPSQIAYRPLPSLV